MSLTAGTRLGPYEVIEAIGKGGAPAARARRDAAERERWGWGPSAVSLDDSRAHAGGCRWL
jgi:hypothetical protein